MSDSNTDLPAIVDAIGDVIGGLDGVPAPIKRSFFKAMNSLITGLAEVPAAWLEMKAGEFKALGRGHQRVMEAAARNAASLAGKSEAVGDRALAYFANDLVREQSNREAVAREALDAVQRLPSTNPCDEPPPVDDDWLHQFRKLASSKSNADVQALFGRILAGEIHCPGSFSPFTLEILARLDAHTARNFEYLANRAIIVNEGMDFVVMTILAGNRSSHETLISGDEATVHLMACGLVQQLGMSQINPDFLVHLKTARLGGQLVQFRLRETDTLEKLIRAPMKGNILFFTPAGSQLEAVIAKEFDRNYARRLKDGMERIGIDMTFPDIDIDSASAP